MSLEKILIVEENLMIATDLADTLVESGYDVVGIVSSGNNAISMAAHVPIDLVLLDVSLPGSMDGVATATQILKRKDLPIVYMATKSIIDPRIQPKFILPYGFLTKPVNHENLLAIIRRAIIYHSWGKIPTEDVGLCFEQYRDIICPELTPESIYHTDIHVRASEVTPNGIAY